MNSLCPHTGCGTQAIFFCLRFGSSSTFIRCHPFVVTQSETDQVGQVPPPAASLVHDACFDGHLPLWSHPPAAPLSPPGVQQQSRTPALVFECINNTDFKVRSGPVRVLAFLLSRQCFSVSSPRPFISSFASPLPRRSCTRSWQIMISVSTCTNYWRWEMCSNLYIY